MTTKTTHDRPRRAQLWLPLALAAVALALAAGRYALQGTTAVWTNTARTFYVADPVLGWRSTEQTWVWLGLDALGALGGLLAGALALTWLLRRPVGEGLARLLRGLLIGAGIAALAGVGAALWAIASGLPPEGARALLPRSGAATSAATAGQVVALGDGPAGAHVLVAHPSNVLVAAIAAGKETFEARFGPITGRATFDPRDLAGRPVSLEVSVDPASIDTGVPLRTKHSRADLAPAEHPTMGFRLARMTSFGAAEGGGVAFAGDGVVAFMGRRLARPVTGTVKALDAAARTRLGLTAEHAYLVQARVAIPLSETPLDLESFDEAEVPVTARFILAHAGEAASPSEN